MKFTILKETFEDRLTTASHFISTRVSSVQSIQGAYIKAEKEGVTIRSSNLSDFYESNISAKVDQEGAVVCDIKKALEFLNFLQPGDIEVELKDNQLVITQGKTNGNFSIYSEDDFPPIPSLDGKKYTLQKNLLTQLPLVLFSASSDEARPVMTGIYITSDKGNLYFVTTDGFRLSLLEHGAGEDLPDVILPAHIFRHVVKMSKGEEKVDMTLSKEDRLVMFTIGQDIMYSRVIEGDYPPYEKVIPKSATTEVEINRQDFIKNMRLASVFAREQADVVIFDISEDGIYLKPKSSQKKDSRVFQEIESLKGEKVTIAFNYKYVLDVLNAFPSDCETIIIKCTQPAAPGMFISENLDGYTHVIMPLRTEETTG